MHKISLYATNTNIGKLNVTQISMPHQRITTTDKQRLFHAHNRADDYVALAQQLGIKRTTAYAIIRRAQRNHGQVALAQWRRT